MERACEVMSITAGVSEAPYPKKMFGSAVKMSMGMSRTAIRIPITSLTRKGNVSLTAATAAPLSPAASAARMML